MLKDDICTVLSPFVGSAAHWKGTEAEAKDALLETLSLLRQSKPKFRDPEPTPMYFGFLERLQQIYFELHEHRFASACNEVYTYICVCPINERRVYNGLVSLLEKLQEGHF